VLGLGVALRYNRIGLMKDLEHLEDLHLEHFLPPITLEQPMQYECNCDKNY